MIDAGIVVHIIECICLNILTLVTSAAKLVVSDNGDILSPNTAPAIIAPAAIPGGIPNWLPIEISAIPAVDAEPHAVPVTTDVTALIKKADIKNSLDSINLSHNKSRLALCQKTSNCLL